MRLKGTSLGLETPLDYEWTPSALAAAWTLPVGDDLRVSDMTLLGIELGRRLSLPKHAFRCGAYVVGMHLEDVSPSGAVVTGGIGRVRRGGPLLHV